MSEVRGYKVFNPDWTCRGFQYEVGKIFEEDVKPSCCDRGFHFCEKAADCFSYYSFNSENKVAEVIALGEVDIDGKKSCTNKIQIVREISWQELLTVVNTGKDCTGLCNSGDWNSGDWNSGDWNSGNRNSGNWNSGNRNSGNCNSGDWNSTSFSSGCFNTEESEIMMFNKPSGWGYKDWIQSEARFLLNQIPKDVVEWIYESDMTNEEKEAHPSYKTTGGYLKKLDESDCAQMWWNGLLEHQRNIIKALPNFDPEIFFQCTGVKVDE